MTDIEILEIVKTDLQIAVDGSEGAQAQALINRLRHTITLAKNSISREGVTLVNEGEETPSVEDSMLIAMYASWLYSKRDKGEGMPRMLRYKLNNRILSEKARS